MSKTVTRRNAEITIIDLPVATAEQFESMEWIFCRSEQQGNTGQTVITLTDKERTDGPAKQGTGDSPSKKEDVKL